MTTQDVEKETKSTISTTKKLAELLKEGAIQLSQVPDLYHTFVAQFGINCWPSRILSRLPQEDKDEVSRMLGKSYKESIEIIDCWVVVPSYVIKRLEYSNIQAIGDALEWIVAMFDVEFANKEIAFEGFL